MTGTNLVNAFVDGQKPTLTPEIKPVPARERRVGTFSFGVTLVAAGVAMTADLVYPSLDMCLLLRFSPIVLILLGVEVLLSARRDGRIRYDWLGMLLCFVLVTLALGVFFVSWFLLRFPAGPIIW